MLSSFTTRFHNFIWFLIFTFTLYTTPYLETLLPYEINLSFPEAEAAEAQQEASSSKTPEQDATFDGTYKPDSSDSSAASAPEGAVAAGSDTTESKSLDTPTTSLKVDEFTGAAHMSYPIAVPPGRSGLSPQLSISYTSTGGNGWLGVGWDLPVGYIQRRGPKKSVPTYDDSKDVYELSLGGSSQELVSIGNNEYRLRIEGALLKIKYTSDGNFWEVWDKSGTKMTFGKVVDSKDSRIGLVRDPSNKNQTFRWCLSRVQDPRTNYMELIYSKDEEEIQGVTVTYQIYLQEIRYNGQESGGLQPNHRVLFNLESSIRSDPIFNYRGGFKMWTRKRLSNIEVWTKIMTTEVLVRKYQIEYKEPYSEPARYNVRSMLSQITLFGNDGQSSLPPVKFTYQALDNSLGSTNKGFANVVEPGGNWPNPSAWSNVNGNYIQNTSHQGLGIYTDVIDMNGDAMPDRVVFAKDRPYDMWTVYFNNGAGFDLGEGWPNPSYFDQWDHVNGNYIKNTSRWGFGTYTDVIDMDGNGLPDRVVFKKNCSPPYQTNCPWTVYFNNNGAGFQEQEDPNWPNPSAWHPVEGNYIKNTSTIGLGTYTHVIDMNGDGLPDRVVFNKDCSNPPEIPCPWTVYFNNGAGFGQGENWPNPSAWSNINGNYIQNTSNLKFGTYTHLIDMNGDGLPDKVVFNKDCTPPYGQNCPWTVYFNYGRGFDQGVSWPNPSAWHPVEGNYIQNTSTIKLGTYTDVIDMNGDGLPDRVVFNKDCTNPPEIPCPWTVYFNNGSGFGPTMGVDWPNPSAWSNINGNYIQNTSNIDLGTYTNVMDMNGDGLPDRVVFNKDCTPPNCPWSVYFNKGPFPDLLSKVENGIGGTIEISYLPSTAYEDAGGNKVNKIPLVVQTVNSYTQSDGRGGSYLHKYFYSEAKYDSVEVEFSGFGQVMAYQMFDAEAYESMTETTFHQDYYKKGKVERQTALSKLAEGHRKEIANTWLVAETLGGGFPYLDTAATTVTDQGVGGPFYFNQTTKNIYDIRSSDLANQTFNLLEERKNEGSPEKIVTLLEYMEDRTNWIFKPIKVTVTNGAGVIASRKWMDYNNEGDLTIEELCKSNTPNTGGCDSRNPTQNVMIYYQYDQTYKVLNQVTDPRLYLTTITYDSTKTFVYGTTKCIDLACTKTYTTTSEYDPGTGNVTKLVPAHLQGTIYWLQTQYDAFGRKKLERMKDNSIPEDPPNLDMGSTTYTYYDTGVATTQNVIKTGRIVIENVPGRTLTLNGTTYYDGLGRTYFATTNGPEGRTIAIETHFDNIGRVWKQSNPYFIGETKYFTYFYYDGFSRLKDTLKTDTYYIHTDYEGLRKVVSKQVTPTEWQSTAYIYDLNQKLVKVGEGFELPGLETYTHYTYDILGNLTQVSAAKDASGNDIYVPITTTMTYDSLMKKKSMSDPDMGFWQYTYDKAGNLLTQTDVKGQTISFDYNDGLNRLTQKTYVNSDPPQRVVYTYDDPTVPYSKGKVTKVSHLVGSNPEVEVAADFVLAYDRMQRVEISKKKIKPEEGPDIEKTFAKSYDSAGRVVSITYPGNKTYSYEYDVAGDLLYVKDNATQNKLVEYSVFTALGQHKFAIFPKPNNVSVKTSYEYYPETGRIKTLRTEKLVNGDLTETYQNLKYQRIDENPGYDGAGNITVLQDLLNNITHNYTYDHLNRLTLAEGAGTNSYTQSFAYDLIGNIDSRVDDGVTTDYTYTYGNKPHAVNNTTGGIDIGLQYDDNGNMIQRVQGGVTTTIVWNYDNKPKSITRGSTAVSFIYDGNGQRVKKQSSINGTTFYFGDLYETRGGAETIHVFAGNQRVASVFLDGTTQFYHTNHLGSSSVITDQYGGRKEQIEYFPFGVYRAVGHVNGTYDFDPNFPDVFYTYTGQEDDDDLGLYNCGARLYDPVLGKFISPDSVVQAPDDPQTLNRYSYARNNPIIYTDPSGNIAIIDDIIVAISSIIASIIPATAGATAYTAACVTVSVAGGAVLGAATSAITGGNIGMGALTGAISGLAFFAAGQFVPVVSGVLGATTPLAEAAVTTAVHAVAGAVSGGINSAITGSDIGLGMLTGAVGAGIGAATGGALTLLEVKQFGFQLVGRTVAGGIAGGVVSEIYGGNFWQGFAQGAATATTAFFFNCILVSGFKFTTFSEFRGQLSSYGLGGLPDWAQGILYVIFVDPTSSMVGGAVTFGHGARHLAGTGLSKEAVESAIKLEVNAIRSSASASGSFWGRIGISGKTIEYRAFTLPDGSIHIGTYYLPK